MSSYATAERLLLTFLKEKKMKNELPLTEETILQFIHWLITVRNLKAGTISSYLAGIRQLHISKGLPEPNIRTSTINLILTGLRNKRNRQDKDKQLSRRPITKEIMAILKKKTKIVGN